jgi:hypothetical protein
VLYNIEKPEQEAAPGFGHEEAYVHPLRLDENWS